MDIEYYNGSALYYYYLCYISGDYKDFPTFLKEEHYQNYAIASLISLFFISNKENIVNKEENRNHSSKIVDEKLAQSISIIAEYRDGKYHIGDYEEENPANIIALIRNKFAHGEYVIDAYKNKIVFFCGDLNIEIEISKLYILICASVCNLVVSPKTNTITRIHPYNNKVQSLGIEQVKNKDDIKKVIKTSRLREYTLYTYDKSNIDERGLEMFSKLMNALIKTKEEEDKACYLIKSFTKIANKNNMNLMITKERIKDEEMDAIVSILDSDKKFYSLPLYDQLRNILTLMCEYKCPDYQNEGYLGGLLLNLAILNRMNTKKIYDFDEILAIEPQIKFNETIEQCFVAGLLAKFNSIYIYPLERVYIAEEFDFSKLDLNFINPITITIDESKLNDITARYNSKINDLIKFKDNFNKLEDNLTKAKLKNNSKGINFIANEIKTKRIEFVDFLVEFKKIETEYKNVKEDYRYYKQSYYNKAIITGIRDSIAHGNVRIKKFMSKGTIEDTIINFKDIYEGNITFEANITIKEFQEFFSKNNLFSLVEKNNEIIKVYKKSND